MQIRLILLVPRLIDRKSLSQINFELLVSKAYKREISNPNRLQNHIKNRLCKQGTKDKNVFLYCLHI